MNGRTKMACLCFLIGIAQPRMASAQDYVSEFIENQIRSTNSGATSGEINTARGDIDGDGDRDVVALYALRNKGGSRNAKYYIALFLNDGNQFRYCCQYLVGQVNGAQSGDSSVDSVSIDNDRNIWTKGEEYREGDPECCPSGDLIGIYGYSDGKIEWLPNPKEGDHIDD